MLIEAIVLLLLITFLFTWYLFMFITKKIKLWRYKPENDKGRRAEESRGFGGRLQGTILPTSPKGFNLLPTASSSSVGEIKRIIGTSSNSIGKSTEVRKKNPFLRR